MNKKIMTLIGPTAIGKTNFIIEKAKQYPIEIVSVDSALVYKQLTIGANKPTEEELSLCPHHLINIVDVNKSYNVQEFITDAEAAVQNILNRGKIPILVGGTMMYIHQLANGLAKVPYIDKNLEENYLNELKKISLAELYDRLKKIDPVFAKKVEFNDTQRIYRGLIVYEFTGRPLSYFWNLNYKSNLSLEIIALYPQDKEKHRNIILNRLKKMIEMGFWDEVQGLWKDYPNQDLDFWKFVGYRQLLNGLLGFTSKKESEEKAFFATAQLAKRQKTWIKKLTENIAYVNFDQNGAFSEDFNKKFEDFLLRY